MRMYGAIMRHHLLAAPARPRVRRNGPAGPHHSRSHAQPPGEETARSAPASALLSLLDHLGLLHQPLGTLLQLGEVRVLVACAAGGHPELGT